MRAFYDFRWPVHRAQYQWVDAINTRPKSPRDPEDEDLGCIWLEVLVRVLTPPPSATDVREYAPLRSEPTLFITFAETEPTEAGILGFANRFGMLGLAREDILTPPLPGVPNKDRLPALELLQRRTIAPLLGEPLERWASEIDSMRQLVRLWEILRRDDPAEIARHIKWRKHKKEVSVFYHVDASIPEPKGDPDGNFILIGEYADGRNPLGLRYGEAHRPARLWIADRVNTRLSGEVSPHLDVDGQGDESVISFAPRSLIGALWLQFALAVAGDADFRACKECGNLFEVSKSASRSDRQFCSTACRVKAYRQRQEVARQMFAEGKSVKEIAEALGCRPDAVKGWVTTNQGTKGRE
jgi:hypothetical protein